MSAVSLPCSVGDLPTPCFVVDKDVCRSNAESMRKKCQDLGIMLRPHMKTHKTLELGEVMTGSDKRGIVVSTVTEARFYADGGFDDITYAFPLTADKLDRCRELMGRGVQLNVMVDSHVGVDMLQQTPSADVKWSVFLAVDTGKEREGVRHDDPEAVPIARKLHEAANINFLGLYSHCGHTYNVTGSDAIADVSAKSIAKLLSLKDKLEAAGIPCQHYGVGSTPAAHHPGSNVTRLTEIHPGNYIFNDGAQCQTIKSCSVPEVACRVMTRVVGHYPHRNQMLIDCGFTALSLDKSSDPDAGYAIFEGHPELRLLSMTQELGKVGTTGQMDLSKFPVGSTLSLIPHHSCNTACMHGVYYVTSGGKVVETYTPCRGF